MSVLKTVARNVFSGWANLAVNLILSFFLAPFIVNQLGSVYYGIWVVTMQLTGYMYLLDFGVRESVIRYVSKNNANENRSEIGIVVNSAIRIYGLISFLCILVSIIIASAFPYIFSIDQENISVTRYVVLITGANMAQFFVFNVFAGVLMGLQRYDIYNKISVVMALVRVGLIVVFLTEGYGILALAIIQLAVNLATNLMVYLKSQKLYKVSIKLKFKIIENLDTIKSLVNYSFFVLLNNICQKIIFYTDAIVIGIFLPPSSITYYAIAGNLIEYLKKLVMSMAEVFNPLTSDFDEKREVRKIQTLVFQSTRISLMIGLPICIVYFTMGKQFIGLWMGSEFAHPAGSVLMILSVTHLLSLPHYSVSSILYGISKHHIIGYLRLGEALANIAISLLLVKRFGIIGIALGTAIPHLISVTVILPTAIAKLLELDLINYLYRSYIKPITSSLPFMVATYFTNQYCELSSLLIYFAMIALLMPLYIIPAWLISFEKEERQWYLAKIKSVICLFRKVE